MLPSLPQVCFLGFLLFIFSCGPRFVISIEPSDAQLTADGQSVTHAELVSFDKSEVKIQVEKPGYKPYSETLVNQDWFQTQKINITLEKLIYNVRIDSIVSDCTLIVDGKSLGPAPQTLALEWGDHALVLTRQDSPDQGITLHITQNSQYLFRPQISIPGHNPLGIFSCGAQPKQVAFSPDNRYLYITLLDGLGFQIFDLEERRMVSNIEPPQIQKTPGFVEGIFVPSHQSFFVSQMMTDSIYEYQFANPPVYRRTVNSSGSWPKVLAFSPSLDVLAVSNWLSHTVVLLDYQTGKPIHYLKNLSTPRGLAFTHDDQFLLIASFDGGFVKKISTKTWEDSGTLFQGGSAMRHLTIAADDSRFWVSDMNVGKVFEVKTSNMIIEHSYLTSFNTNTIALVPDETVLYASNRGPNNPISYLYRSPSNGEITIIDLKKHQVIGKIEGGNQPTGLAVSPNGKQLAFSNFLDGNFELYERSSN